jgi:hypothetical protein
MLGHEYESMPDRQAGLVEMLLRCRWCFKTPMKAREDGCPIRELQEVGTILLSDYNPEGVKHFEGRLCVTCDGPIMGHALRRDSAHYWCFPNQNQFSNGITDCVFDVGDVKVPEEPAIKDLPLNN